MTEETGFLFQLPKEYAPRIAVYANVASRTGVSDIGKIAGVAIDTNGKVDYYQAQPLNYQEGFNIQYPLKRN